MQQYVKFKVWQAKIAKNGVFNNYLLIKKWIISFTKYPSIVNVGLPYKYA